MIGGGSLNTIQVGGALVRDEEAYQLWLRNPPAVGHIVLISYNGGSAVYPNWVKYTLKLSDFERAGYREVVKSIPSFARAISDDLIGPVSESFGDLVLDTTDGSLDLWHNLSIDGQSVRIFQGDPTWAVERFRLLIECIAETVTSVTEEMTIRLRSLDHGADLPIQTNLIPSNVASTAPSNLPIPKAFGTVFNVTPACVDQANQTYQWNDGVVVAVTDARDDGMPFRTNQIALSAVNATTDVLSTALPHGFYKDTRVRCDVGTLPAAAQWSCLAWNGQIFCAVAFGTNLAAISTDGIHWTQHLMPSVADWRTIAWNGAVFCVVAYQSTKAATSPDGIIWTEQTLPSNDGWIAMAWNGSIFCVLGANSATAITSPDGANWTAQTLPSSSAWVAIAWNGAIFCAIAGGSTAAATSADGETWTARTLPSGAAWRAIAWSGSVFAIVAAGPSTSAASSPDGIIWTAQTLPQSSNWIAIAWSGVVFCAVATASFAGDVATASSPDGETWTLHALPTMSNWYSLAWNGYIFCTLGAGTNLVSISSDGATWSATTNTLPTPLAINTDYWVPAEGLTATTFKLAATRGGNALDITAGGPGAVIVGYHWTADLATGKVYCDSKPSGVLTLDGIQGVSPAAYVIGEILNAINVDVYSRGRFALTCPQPFGIYIADRQNRLDVANAIMSGLGTWYGYNRYSLLQFGRIEGSYSDFKWTLAEDQMDDGSFVIERLIPPVKMHRMGFRHNWTNQDGKLVAEVSTESRGLYSSDYSATAPVRGADEGPNGKEFHALAIKPDVIDSMLTYGSDALAEALRRDAMFYGWGVIFSCTVGLIGSAFDPGDVVKVTHSRFNCAGGVLMALVYVEDRPTERATLLKFFSALPGYTPGHLPPIPASPP